MKCMIIGGGIIGLSAAWFLQQDGWDVTILERNDFSDSCSYGNAGYVCPSHFVPMATPGIVKLGLKWMLQPDSPFYIQPRLNADLIDWGWKFIRSANNRRVQAAYTPLRDIALLSQYWYEQWAQHPDLAFAYEKRGMLEMFKTSANEEHAYHAVQDAVKLGLDAALLDAKAVRALEPDTDIDIRGAIHYRCDAQLYPDKLMHSLQAWLKAKGVKMISNAEVTGFETTGGKITKVLTATQAYDTDMAVIATGSWSRGVAAKVGVKLPMVGGRGYSVTYEDSPYHLRHPAILTEGRVAVSPMDGNKIRFGGTMEITGLDAPPSYKRVKGILKTVKEFFPAFDIPMPAAEKIWYGYRPCSADGLPYIGKPGHLQNCIIATGHSMLGISLGAGTGKLVAELAKGGPTSMSTTPFNPERF
ncbi:FAD-binding oxidoreductase [Chitinophaga sp. Mgbs1]|uniref:FAD-binding oxidoreductase n=1 Tax=Chitinophaga solisilvae TaxID=1233460 RepID=A0A433WMK2_9BACT|nr:FAD-binding oxidoreductase [Chitinophaga solisilvae]